MTVGRIAFAAPWTADETRHGYDRVIRSAKRDPVALVQIAGWDKRSATANANLIAAAPELLAALKAVLGALPAYGTERGSRGSLNVTLESSVIDGVIDAIAKAEGRQE